MTEQPNVPAQPAGEDEPPATRTDTNAAEHGAVRTQGETDVDDAIGSGDNEH